MAAYSKMRSKDVLAAFLSSQPVRDAKVDDEIKLLMDPFSGTIECDNCHFNSVATTCSHLHGAVRFTNCAFKLLDFYATYFIGGLIMDHCTVDGGLSFQSGGHNDQPILIHNTTFNSFVDFEDCWFTGPMHLHNVHFEKGTNLLGNENSPMAVSFDVPPEFQNVRGDLQRNTYQRSMN